MSISIIDDPNLKQGIEFLDLEKEIINKIGPTLPLIEETSSPKLGSIKEGLDSGTGTTSSWFSPTEHVLRSSCKSSKCQNLLESLQDTKSLIDRKNIEIDIVWEQIQTAYLQNKESVITSKGLTDYLGKYIQLPTDGQYAYVNNYGYLQKYAITQTTAPNLPTSALGCPTTTPKILSEDLTFANFPEGITNPSERVIGQPCGFAGKNIVNKVTEEIAWVDIKGVKHVFSSTLQLDPNITCTLTNAIELDNDNYNSIPTGTPMLSTTVCNELPGVTDSEYTKLFTLQEELSTLILIYNEQFLDLQTQINLETGGHSHVGRGHSHVGGGHSHGLGGYGRGHGAYGRGQDAPESPTSYADVISKSQTIIGEEESTHRLLTSNYYKYLVWIILAITILAILVYSIMADQDSMIVNGLLLIVVLFLIYFLANSFYYYNYY